MLPGPKPLRLPYAAAAERQGGVSPNPRVLPPSSAFLVDKQSISWWPTENLPIMHELLRFGVVQARGE